MKTLKSAVLVAALALAGCAQKNEAPATPPAPPPASPAAAQAPAAPAQPAAQAVPAAAEPQHEGCAGEHGTDPVKSPEAITVTDPSGATRTLAGEKLAGAPVVTIADLLAKPEELAGKPIQIEGNVSAMCTHERAWFAIQEEGRNGGVVRVITAPMFLVPEGSIGKKARAEGVVEVTEVAAEAARHYAKDHQVGDPNAGQGEQPVKSIIVRATGAEFF